MSPFRLYSSKLTQLFNTDPLGWGILLLGVALYYLCFFTLTRPGMILDQLTALRACSLIPILIGANVKERRGALLAWLLMLIPIVIGAIFAVGIAWTASTLMYVLSVAFAFLLIALATGQFRSIANRLRQENQKLREMYDELALAHTIIQNQALIDGLTGLPNHRAIKEQLHKELERARRYPRSLSILFFDADRFKRVNDTHGHAAGDAVLRQIGERAESVLRGGDTIGRFGGEEFVILLPEADAEEAREIAERIRAIVAAEPVATSEVEGGLVATISIGFSTYPIDGDSEQKLLLQADEAMYIAKRLGRNQVRSAEEARQMGADAGLMALLRDEEQREATQREEGTPEELGETSTEHMINSLLSSLERRDADLSTHAHTISYLATAISQRRGPDPEEKSRIGIGALLHGMGKVAIPGALLQNIDPLPSHEHIDLQEHAESGAQIMEDYRFQDHLTASNASS